jgi:hypothetical protein
MRDVPAPSDDDQSRTWDGRVLDTKESVLEFLARSRRLATVEASNRMTALSELRTINNRAVSEGEQGA